MENVIVKRSLYYEFNGGIGMMSKKTDNEALQYDQRIISRRLLGGEISEKELQAYLNKIPDVAENAEEITIDEDEAK